ncbi:uncharacterized protein CHSO_3894 [Chryseobacterium sp. StRB126]|uniref:TIGR04141 family sporadically distributed protein n=1 Tax=Chryseobacterium sp. StRB126 TaxID=878220 RepID=UPI0004E9982F|nr:TIGR04141 family sporadically distributed protein [Chryseobacterium sp. StRB126]BAP32931.1 uncharacterized protein CHSO_3894 [Chryseobacterium sp. StRB126]
MRKDITKKLAIFLIKDKFKNYNNLIKSNDVIRYKLKNSLEEDGIIIIGKEKSTEPEWKALLESVCEDDIPRLNNTSNKAVLFFKKNNRIFAICFGYGKSLLKDECIEREFGLKTALNIIDADKLISVDKANIGDLNLLTKTQASKKGSPSHFEIDILRDLIKGVTGEPKIVKENLYGNIITGNDGIHISPRIRMSKVPNILKSLYSSYVSNEYKERFDWIDNIKPEKDPIIIEKLRDNLISSLNIKDDTIHLAPPYLIDWEKFEYLSYTPKGEKFTEFDIANFYTYKFKDHFEFENWEKLVNQNIYIKFTTEDIFHNKLWHFINYETEFNGFKYIFTSSNWYRISKNYYEDIYNYCSQIEESESHFIDCLKSLRAKTKSQYDEGIYNEELAMSNKNYILFDKKLIKSDISRSQIEVCDVFNKSNKELIHIKIRESSSTLSHLFSQGKVSSNSLQKDKIFRKNIRKFLKENRELIPLEDKDFKTDNYTITYAIIVSKNKNFVDSLPFFSLVNFRLTLEELINRGFHVRVKTILKK